MCRNWLAHPIFSFSCLDESDDCTMKMIHHSLRLGLFMISLLILPLVGWSQGNQSDFQVESFSTDDLLLQEIDRSNQISGANRVLESADELAVRTIIITKEEIRRNGFVTLVDVLKTLPGFRTSQPGSAQLGETFLMRGLVGNLYAKFLLNGIPIAPSAAAGMPLGAQLPIQAAERIEIILGPAGSVYGADAMAGVINIVMAEVERPVEAYAGVALNPVEGATYLHLSLGGKVGADKDIVDYNFYAASWERNNLNLLLDRDSIRSVNYDLVKDNPNWRGDPENDSLANIRDIPQAGQLLGMSVKYRDLSYNYQFMQREDHSALGSHFIDMDYSNTNARLGDVIQTHQLRYQKEVGKTSLTTNASGVFYAINSNSSYDGVAHPLSSGRNFIYAASRDYQLEQLVNFRPLEGLSILVGLTGALQTGDAFQGYLGRPFNDGQLGEAPDGTPFIENGGQDSISNISVVSRFDQYSNLNLGAFSQVYYRRGKWKLSGGARLDKIADLSPALSPKFGFFFRPSDRLRFRGMATSGFRVPSIYNQTNNYRGQIDTVANEFSVARYTAELEPERLTSFELGGDYDVSSHFSISGHAFFHQRKNSIIPVLRLPGDILGNGGGVVLIDTGGPPPVPGGNPLTEIANNFEVGFYNANTQSQLLGLQGFLNFDNQKWLRVECGGQVNIGSEAGEFFKADTSGALVSTIYETKRFSSMPDVMGTLNLHFNLPENFRISIYAKAFSEYQWALQAVNDSLLLKSSDGGYYNVDAVASKDFGGRLTFYVRCTNLTQSTNKGIYTNTLSGYQFPYIPQMGRNFLFGLTFDLNRRAESL